MLRIALVSEWLPIEMLTEMLTEMLDALRSFRPTSTLGLIELNSINSHSSSLEILYEVVESCLFWNWLG